MVETEFVIRCSGRVEYAKALIIGAIFTYGIMKFHSLSPIQFPLNTAYMVIWGVVALFIIAAFIRAKIQYIDVNSEGVTMHAGLINKKTNYAPYSKIDNVKIDRNLIERVFFLGTLGIDTAASDQIEIQMANVPSHYLTRIQAYIQKKTEDAHAQTLAPPPAPRRF